MTSTTTTTIPKTKRPIGLPLSKFFQIRPAHKSEKNTKAQYRDRRLAFYLDERLNIEIVGSNQIYQACHRDRRLAIEIGDLPNTYMSD